MAAHDQGLSRDDGPVTQSPDTSPEIETLVIASARGMTPAQKWRQVCGLTAAGENLALVGIDRRYPAASDDERRLRLAALKYDRDFVRAALGWDPHLQGW